MVYKRHRRYRQYHSACNPSLPLQETVSWYVSQSSVCGESPRSPITVNVIAAPAIPSVSSPVIYCSGVAAKVLTASGSSLRWYTAAAGDTGTTTAPTPVTDTAANITYYVSQGTKGCESPRASITVIVHETPEAPVS